MELEFDKEIDAILRKARGGGGVTVKVSASAHIDADAVAAFAENTVPPRTRLLYTEHFADCDPCRRLLSQTILLSSEANLVTNPIVFAPILSGGVPWYQTLLKPQNLALAMGALVLTFGSILAVLVLQDRSAETGSTLSQVTEPETQGGPVYGEDPSKAVSNVVTQSSNAATSMSRAANMIGNVSPLASEPTVIKPAAIASNVGSAPSAGALPESDVASRAEDKLKEQSTGAAAPRPSLSAPLDGITAERSSKDDSDNERKVESREVQLSKRKQLENSRSRDFPPAKGGRMPSGPMQNQSSQSNNGIFDMTAPRSVGGKAFNNRDGVWYDAAYKNQATSNFRRGTSEYKNLDSGLRNIADTLGGTVVIVWKQKAYRIQ